MTEYKTVYSKRKTLAITIKPDGSVIVRAPFGTSEKRISEAVYENSAWIEKNLEKIGKSKSRFTEASPAEEKALRSKAKDILPRKVEYYSALIGVTPTKITVTGAKTRFGSCSGKNSISFSFYLMRFPDEAIDYVVVHELCHIIHHNHSEAFYKEIEKILPDYKQRQKLLKS